MTTTIALTRSDLARLFPNNPKAVLAFEGLFQKTEVVAQAVTVGAEATQSINDATVVTLSPNEAFTNERVLAFDPEAFQVTDGGPGGNLALALVNLIVLNGGYRCTFNMPSDVNIDLPSTGTLLTDEYLTDGPYASDAAAATGGVAVGGLYRKTGGTVVWRVA